MNETVKSEHPIEMYLYIHIFLDLIVERSESTMKQRIFHFVPVCTKGSVLCHELVAKVLRTICATITFSTLLPFPHELVWGVSYNVFYTTVDSNIIAKNICEDAAKKETYATIPIPPSFCCWGNTFIQDRNDQKYNSQKFCWTYHENTIGTRWLSIPLKSNGNPLEF